MRHEFTVSKPSRPVLLDADPVRLAQVVSNLLNNAAKYTKPGGHVWLTAEGHGNDAVISVRDDGAEYPAICWPASSTCSPK